MKPNSLFLIVSMLLLLLAVPVHPAAQEHSRYKLIDLGTPGGPQGYLNIPANSYARILNNRGMIAGSADTSVTDPYPNFCFNQDCVVSLAFQGRKDVRSDLAGLSDGLSSAANWISANGLIAGLSENGEIDPLFPGFPELRAVLWKNGNIVDLGTLPEGGYESIANAVNRKGQVAGFALNTIPDPNSMAGPGFWPTETRAFVWENGTMQDLGTLGGTDAMALLINERGQIVGDSYTSSNPSAYCANPDIGFPLTTGAFLWEKGKIEDLGNFGGTCTFAFALNDRGQVVGASTLTGDQAQHPFLWERGSMTDLGTFGGNLGNALAISDTGKVVGWATLPGDQVYHASLWNEEGMTDLGTLPGFVNSFAFDVNAQGQIVGFSTDSQFFNFHAFLWQKGHMLDLDALIASSGLQLGSEVANINDRGEIAGEATDVNGNLHAVLLVPCAANDNNCQDVAANPTFSPVPTTVPAGNQEHAIRRRFHRRLGPLHEIPAPGSSFEASAPIEDFLHEVVPFGSKTPALACLPKGAQCRPGYHCCAGLVCVPASTRAFCEP